MSSLPYSRSTMPDTNSSLFEAVLRGQGGMPPQPRGGMPPQPQGGMPPQPQGGMPPQPQMAGGFMDRMTNFSMQPGPPMSMQSPPPLNGVRADGISANDLQRQLNRGTVAAEDLASTQASINELQTQVPMPSPPPFTPPAGPMGPPPSPFGNAGPMLEEPQVMGPPPQQQIQPSPQPPMAGGYGLTGAYQGDQFSQGVMSLPQIQDNFYSPPAGSYTAPPITSPYSMF